MPVRGPGGKPPPSTLQERFAELTARNYLELKEHTRHDYSPVPSPSAATGQQPLPNVGTTPLPPLPPLPPSLPPLSSLLLLPSLPSLPQPPLTAMMVACVCTTAQAQRRVSHAESRPPTPRCAPKEACFVLPSPSRGPLHVNVRCAGVSDVASFEKVPCTSLPTTGQTRHRTSPAGRSSEVCRDVP